jgi:hypothetical protein
VVDAMTGAVLKTPLLWLSAMCAACALTLLLFMDFEGSFLAALSGFLMYVAHERIRIAGVQDP